MFLTCVDKHAPLKLKRVCKKRCPWVTGDVLYKTRRRDFLKKKAVSSNDSAAWDQYKRARNRANNAIKLAKKLYVSDNLEANKGNLRKTWNTINEITSRNSGKTSSILEIKADNKVVSNPEDIATEPRRGHATCRLVKLSRCRVDEMTSCRDVELSRCRDVELSRC